MTRRFLKNSLKKRVLRQWWGSGAGLSGCIFNPDTCGQRASDSSRIRHSRSVIKSVEAQKSYKTTIILKMHQKSPNKEICEHTPSPSGQVSCTNRKVMSNEQSKPNKEQDWLESWSPPQQSSDLIWSLHFSCHCSNSACPICPSPPIFCSGSGA